MTQPQTVTDAKNSASFAPVETPLTETPTSMVDATNQPEGLTPELDLSQLTKKNWPSSKNVSQ